MKGPLLLPFLRFKWSLGQWEINGLVSEGKQCIIADFIGNWACQERQTRFPYGYKGIIMFKKENVNQKDTICDTKKAAT